MIKLKHDPLNKIEIDHILQKIKEEENLIGISNQVVIQERKEEKIDFNNK